jgi:hypothetical protein
LHVVAWCLKEKILKSHGGKRKEEINFITAIHKYVETKRG